MEYTLGEIALFPFSFEMVGWMRCAGQTLPIQQYQALYSLIMTTYGGDGRTTFALPNLLGTEPHPSCCYYICVSGYYPQRN